jgi:O-antigen ligase
LLSVLLNDNYRAGFGILKSWFLLPILFSFAVYAKTTTEQFVEKIYLSIFLSAALVGFIAAVYKLLGYVTYDGRLSAFYLSPNHLAMYLSAGLFFGFYFLLKYFPTESYSRIFFVCLVLFIFIIFPLHFTFSYSAWLAVVISLFATAALIYPRKKYFLLTGLIALISIVLLFQINTPKFSTLTNFSQKSSFTSRAAIWKASFLMLKQHPLIGIGAGNFQNEYLAKQKYFPPYPEWAVPQPHNIFLAFWLQSGILGLIGFLLLLIFVFRNLFSLIRHKKSAALATPLLGFFIYTVLHGLIDTPYWKNDLSFLFWLCVFLLLVLQKSKNDTV